MIEQSAIILPLIAQVSLSFFVMCYLGYQRISYMQNNRIHPQKVATRSLSSEVFQTISAPSDNFKNLFEVPTLFFPLPIILIQLNLVDNIYLYSAWIYVFLRVIHSITHCRQGSVNLRFFAFATSSLILWAIWLRLCVSLI